MNSKQGIETREDRYDRLRPDGRRSEALEFGLDAGALAEVTEIEICKGLVCLLD